ncbi:MAG: hypothetical protein GXO71_06265 [Caldiserica bacterium]|nr:hypothetical protein [Caldisericota bacterium]
MYRMAGLKVPPHYVFLADSLSEKVIQIIKSFSTSPLESNIELQDFGEILGYVDNCLQRFYQLISLMEKRVEATNGYFQNRRSSTRREADVFADWLLYPVQEMVSIRKDVKRTKFSPPYSQFHARFLAILGKPIRTLLAFMGDFITAVKHPEERVKDSHIIRLSATTEIRRDGPDFLMALRQYQREREISAREENRIQQRSSASPERRGFSIWNMLGVWFLFKFLRRS